MKLIEDDSNECWLSGKRDSNMSRGFLFIEGITVPESQLRTKTK